MKSRTYTPVSRESFERIKEALQQEGACDAGVFRMHGVEMLYVFSEEAKCLTVSLQHKPWLVPESAVWDTVERAIQPYLGTSEDTRGYHATRARKASYGTRSTHAGSNQQGAPDSPEDPKTQG